MPGILCTVVCGESAILLEEPRNATIRKAKEDAIVPMEEHLAALGCPVKLDPDLTLFHPRCGDGKRLYELKKLKSDEPRIVVVEKLKGRLSQANFRANPAEAAQQGETRRPRLDINIRSLTDDHRADISENRGSAAAALPGHAEELRMDCSGSHAKLETRLDQVFEGLKDLEKSDGELNKRVEKAEMSTVGLINRAEEILKANEEMRKASVELKTRVENVEKDLTQEAKGLRKVGQNIKELDMRVGKVERSVEELNMKVEKLSSSMNDLMSRGFINECRDTFAENCDHQGWEEISRELGPGDAKKMVAKDVNFKPHTTGTKSTLRSWWA